MKNEINTTDYKHLLDDETYCFDLTDSDIAGHHKLCDLSALHGHASLQSYLNDYDAWGKTVGEVAKMLIGE